MSHIPPISAGYPARPGHRVAPWIDGVPFYTRLLEVMRTARQRCWVAVSFIERGFIFPDGGTFWDELDACQTRGVDVRVLFWSNPRFVKTIALFLGTDEDRAFLAARSSTFAARWDASPDPSHCHHQKAWLVDDLAFIGGMVLTNSTLQTAAHDARPESKHDAFLEIAGPAVRDAAHNFAQRWNEAVMPVAPWPDPDRAGPLPLPSSAPPAAGDVTVQLSRTLPPGHYASSPAGETGVWQQYQAAFSAARETIYIENQHPGEKRLLQLLDAALARGVEVVYVLPAQPMHAVRVESERARRGQPGRYLDTFRALAALAEHERFTLAGLARNWGETYAETYVHAKLCVIDGVWATCGSANLVDLSLHADHSELNASFWCERSASALLDQLLAEHMGRPTTGDARTDLAAFRALARANAQRRAAGQPLVGYCYALDPTTYPP